MSEEMTIMLWWLPAAWPMLVTMGEFLATGVWTPTYGVLEPSDWLYNLYHYVLP